MSNDGLMYLYIYRQLTLYLEGTPTRAMNKYFPQNNVKCCITFLNLRKRIVSAENALYQYFSWSCRFFIVLVSLAHSPWQADACSTSIQPLPLVSLHLLSLSSPTTASICKTKIKV